jgi:lipoprotein NlpD
MRHMQRMPFLLLAVAAFLGGCAHSRIVHRDYSDHDDGRRDRRSPILAHVRDASEALPRDAIHIVRAGETLYGISFRYGLRYQDVAAWNDISDPYTIEIGQRLTLRPGSGSAARPGAHAGPPRPMPPSRSAASPAPIVHAAPPIIQAPAGDIGSQSIGGGPAWSWPAHGQIIGRYVAGDQTQQGINIAGTAGQEVRAAADGIVVYSGAGLTGYGELIIIKHSDEWLSAYGHNRRRLAGEGTRVKAGDVIAEMGRTGAVRDMLHFEIRRNGKPVDPLGFLPKP